MQKFVKLYRLLRRNYDFREKGIHRLKLGLTNKRRKPPIFHNFVDIFDWIALGKCPTLQNFYELIEKDSFFTDEIEQLISLFP